MSAPNEGNEQEGKVDDAKTMSAEELEQLKKKELAAAVEAQKARREARERNASLKDRDIKGLKSDLKKSMAIVRRIKTFDDPDVILSQIKTINLTRYVSEFAQALVQAATEGKIKVSDIGNAGKISEVMHRYYKDFTLELVTLLKKSLDTRSLGGNTEGAMPVSCTRTFCRYFFEVYALGLYDEAAMLRFVLQYITIPSPPDTKPKGATSATERTVSLANMLLKHYGGDLLGLKSKDEDAVTADNVASWAANTARADTPPILGEKERAEVLEYFVTILKDAVGTYEATVTSVKELWQENTQIVANKGELPEDRKQQFCEAKKNVDKFHASLVSLKTAIGSDLELPDPVDMGQFTSGETNTTITFTSGMAAFYAPVDEFGTASLFDDEDQRAFYEDFPDLSSCLPEWAVNTALRKALMRGEKVVLDVDEEKEEGEGAEGDDALPLPGTSKVSFSEDPKEDKKEKEKDKDKDKDKDKEEKEKRVANFAQIDALLKQLPDKCIGRAAIDEWLLSFTTECYNPPGVNAEQPSSADVAFIANFAANSRRKLMRHIFDVPRTKLSLLPFYARIAAACTEWWKDFGVNLANMYEEEFEKLYRQQNQIHIEQRRRNIRFLSELCKAKLYPPASLLRCLATLIDNFVHHNIEIATHILEVAGRYLYRNQASSVRLQNLLQHIKRQQHQKHMDPRHEMMVEAALKECIPPEASGTAARTGKKKKVRHETEQFIRYLVFARLVKNSVVTVSRSLRKLTWDEDVMKWVAQTLVKVHKVKYSNVNLLASLCLNLSKYYPELKVRVVDKVIEEIRLGLELTVGIDQVHAIPLQRRLLQVELFGELYNYMLVDEGHVFDVLHMLLYYAGWNDFPNYYFRIRMIVHLLNTTIPYFSEMRSGRRKLYRFLPFFYQYVHSKAKPFPVDLDFAISEAMELIQDYASDRANPLVKRYITFPTTAAEANKMVAHVEAVLGGEDVAGRQSRQHPDPLGGKNPARLAFINNLRYAPGNPSAPFAEGRKKQGLLSNNIVPFRNKIYPVTKGGHLEDEEEEDDDDEETVKDEDGRKRGKEEELEADDQEEPGETGKEEKRPDNDDDPANDEDYSRGKFLIPGGALFSKVGVRGRKEKVSEEDAEFDAMFSETLKDSLQSAKQNATLKQMGKARISDKISQMMSLPLHSVAKAGDDARANNYSNSDDDADTLLGATRETHHEEKVPYTVVLRRKGDKGSSVVSTKVGGRALALGTIQVPMNADLVLKQRDRRQQEEDESAKTKERILELQKQSQLLEAHMAAPTRGPAWKGQHR